MTDDPVLHTKLPAGEEGHYGEYELGQLLKNFSGQGLEFWFDLKFLPNVPDIDLLIYSRKVGIFVCEVKSLTMQQIQDYSLTDLIRADGTRLSHPVFQVRRNSQQLRTFHSRMLKTDSSNETIPFIQTTVIWPKITRAQWEQRFKTAALKAQAKSFVFQDDLLNARRLNEKLAEFQNRPLLGVHPPVFRPREKHGVASLAEYIRSAQQLHTRALKARSEKPADVAFLEKELAKYPFGEQHKVVFSGSAGTGKTSFLIQLGMQHARVGGSVLYLCYNRALATEVQSQVQVLRNEEPMLGHIDVFDEYAFYESLDPEIEYLGHEVTAEDVIRCLKKIPQEELVKYDTILIDEGQDIDGKAITVANYLTVSDSSWFISISKGQELYGFSPDREQPCVELQEIMVGAKKPVRNRLFRNAEIPFLASHAFLAHFPSRDKVKKFITEKVLSTRYEIGEEERQQELPTEAKLLTLNYLPSDEIGYKESVKSAVLEALHDVQLAGPGSDLMVIVFGDKSPAYPIVKTALREARSKIHDLTIESNRRLPAPSGSVRIVKAMGSRGLAASHVLLFDFDYIETWCAADEGRPPAKNLSYVVLTRGAHSTKVYVESENITENVKFLRDVIDELRLARLTKK